MTDGDPPLLRAASRAPGRISLAGGGTDVSPYTDRFGGAVVNMAITRYAWADLTMQPGSGLVLSSRDDGSVVRAASSGALVVDGTLDILKAVTRAMHHDASGLELAVSSDMPPLSGLGGSAALFVAAIGVFNRRVRAKRLDLQAVAELAWHLEREELCNLGGRQDQYAAAFGGLNFLEFRGKDGARVSPLRLGHGLVHELERRLLLFHLGSRPRGSGTLIERQVQGMQTGANLEALHRTRELALAMKQCLALGHLDEVGELLHLAWEQKKRFTDGITDPRIDAIYRELRQAGAVGGKLTGAGGGGHMVVYVPPPGLVDVRRAAHAIGLDPVPYTVDFSGLQTWTLP